MNNLISRTWNNVLLSQHLNAVRDELGKSEWTYAVRTEPILQATESFAFQYRRNAKQQREHHHDSDDSAHCVYEAHVLAGAGCGGAAVLGAGGAAFFAFSAARFASTAAASVGWSLW